MEAPMIRRTTVRCMSMAALGLLPAAFTTAQPLAHYQATIQSLDTHRLPQWDDDAKLGIFIHWGLYSVSGWAPFTLLHSKSDVLFKTKPYAEWYYNTVRIAGSPRRNITVNTLAQTTTTIALPTALTVKTRSGILDRGRKSLRTPAPNTLF
jgi:hypothetical protein